MGDRNQGGIMRLSFLHTGDIHVATFEALAKELGFDGVVTHQVEQHLLDRARVDGIDAVRGDTLAVLEGLSEADAVLCTCSTIGPLTDEMASRAANIIRIDRPALTAACQHGGRPAIAICLDSTRAPTLALLAECAEAVGVEIEPSVIVCADAWPFFEAGDMAAFAKSIAKTVRAEAGDADCIVLAQASMRVAEADLTDLDIPLITTPRLAVEQAISVARGQAG